MAIEKEGVNELMQIDDYSMPQPWYAIMLGKVLVNCVLVQYRMQPSSKVPLWQVLYPVFEC